MAIRKFKVTDNLSFSLISTIPKKVISWLGMLEQDLSEEYIIDLLSANVMTVKFDNFGGSVKAVDPAGNLYTVDWTGAFAEPESVLVSDEALLDVHNNLQRFVDLERAFYDTISELQKSIEAADLLNTNPFLSHHLDPPETHPLDRVYDDEG